MAELGPDHRTTLSTFDTVARYAVAACLEPRVRFKQYPRGRRQQRQNPMRVLVPERHDHGLVVLGTVAFGHDELGPVKVDVAAVDQVSKPVDTEFPELCLRHKRALTRVVECHPNFKCHRSPKMNGVRDPCGSAPLGVSAGRDAHAGPAPQI